MLGEKELVKLFPDFADLVQPSGIDLELDRIYTQESAGSLIDNEKKLPGPTLHIWPASKGKSRFLKDIPCFTCHVQLC